MFLPLRCKVNSFLTFSFIYVIQFRFTNQLFYFVYILAFLFCEKKIRKSLNLVP